MTIKKFAVAYHNMFSGELKLELVEAEDAFHAAISYLGHEKQDTGATNLEMLQEELWDSEEQIEVLEIKSPGRNSVSWGPGMDGPLPLIH